MGCGFGDGCGTVVVYVVAPTRWISGCAVCCLEFEAAGWRATTDLKAAEVHARHRAAANASRQDPSSQSSLALGT